jgi:immune inhibitor A
LAGRARGARRRLIAIVPALGLAAAGLAVSGAAAPGGDAADTTVARYQPTTADYYINYTPPRVQPDTQAGGERVETGEARRRGGHAHAHEIDRKFASGNPVAAKVLMSREAKAARTGKNPIDFIFKKSKTTRTAKLLTILVEFNENANDDFSGFSRPRSTADVNDCVTEPAGTLLNGPLHNKIPNPALAAGGGKDNNSMWVPDFSPEHYNKMLYSKQGITKRVRTDLTDPRDGKKGIDISGYTMKNMYEEMSKGAYSVTGEAIGWIKVPHSEAWYGAGACGTIPQDMSGHPDNPRGVGQLPIDVIETLAAQRPDFPWADYDVEDVSDADGDGNFHEPDGVIDHLVLVHAGADKSGGGGAEGTYAIWAHSSAVPGGHPIPGTDLKISNYIVQPEDSGVGVFAHEYGHDLGLPDLYDTSGQGESDVDFWDLMSSGSHAGPIFQSMPTHMGLWDKWVLGWADPKVLNPGDAARAVTVGQTSRTPKLTEDGVRINLPDKQVELATPHSGANMWWSGSDQDWADVKLTRTVEVPADARFWMWNNYVIEEDWDFGFVEVSTDGGATWTEQKVYDEAGNLVSTGDDYADPNGRLHDYGNKKYGLTGDTHGWRHDYVDLTAYAGQTVQLRLRYATDAAFLERGWFADDFALTSGGTTVWSDDVEGGANGWTGVKGTFTDTSGTGWTIHGGTLQAAQYYLAEWRNFDGFDKGLQYAYDTTWNRDGAWRVEKIKYNAPGLLLWYRDAAWPSNNITGSLFSPPSIGPKGQLLIVDSHFEPLRRSGAAAEKDPSTLKNLPSRPQSSNAAFTFGKTYPFKECLEGPGEPFSAYCTQFGALPAVKEFADAKTWYPGLEVRDGSLFYRHRDASVVIPSRDEQPYTTRVVNPDGSPATELYGENIAGHILGTGNPGDEGKQLGVKLRLLSPLPGNLGVLVHVTPPKKAPQR